jgi:PAS domain S-box-containing protein
MAAEQALRLLNGESADRIPVVTAQNANTYTFDYRQLERLGIPETALPPGSVFINRPDSFYEQNKRFIWTLVGVILMLTGFVILLSVTVIRRRRTEELLRRATLVVESSPAILFRWKAAEGWPVELVSANVGQLGYTPEELLSGSVPFSSLVHPDDLDRVAAEVEEHTAAGGDSFQQEYRIVRKDGVVRWIDDRTVIERDAEGRVTHYQGIIIDITERKGAEEAIQQSEEKFRSLFMSLNEGFYLSELIYDDNGNPCDYRYLDVNPEFELILGLDRDQIIGKRYKELVPVDSTHWLANYFKVALTGEPCTYTFYSNEYRMHFETYAYQPVKGQVCVLVINVTERKRAEEALRESEEKFRVLAETSPTAIILCQGERIIYANPATTSLSGYTEEELSCMNFWDCIHEDFREMVRERGLARQRGEAVPEQYESVIVTRRGEHRRVVVCGAPMIYGGVPTSIITLLDITEARRAEEKLRLTEEMFSSAFRASPDAITVNRLDDGLYLDANEGFCEMTGYAAEEVLGRTSVDLNIWVRLEDRERLVREMTRHGSVKNMEAEFRRKDGTVLVGQMSARIIETDGAPCIVNIVRDVTERKRAEEQIRASLAEKIVLLKEIHHRVKNNMQIISALLELQSDSIADEASRRFISESQNRIRSMALVHEKLYHSESFASINFGDYIESLTQYLFSCFVKDPDLIELKVEAGDFSMVIDEAIPCGLIVNELVSNSLKHAFPGGRKGEIAVRCRYEEGGHITLTVSDTGVGLPPALDIRNSDTLGLQLVTMLSKQLRGEVVVDGGTGGTFVSITFPGSRRA